MPRSGTTPSGTPPLSTRSYLAAGLLIAVPCWRVAVGTRGIVDDLAAFAPATLDEVLDKPLEARVRDTVGARALAFVELVSHAPSDARVLLPGRDRPRMKGNDAIITLTFPRTYAFYPPDDGWRPAPGTYLVKRAEESAPWTSAARRVAVQGDSELWVAEDAAR